MEEGLPWGLIGKESTCQCRRHRLSPWVRKVPWRRNGSPRQYFCLGHPTDRRLVGYSPWGHKRVRHDSATEQQEEERWKRVLLPMAFQLQILSSSQVTISRNDTSDTEVVIYPKQIFTFLLWNVNCSSQAFFYTHLQLQNIG